MTFLCSKSERTSSGFQHLLVCYDLNSYDWRINHGDSSFSHKTGDGWVGKFKFLGNGWIFLN